MRGAPTPTDPNTPAEQSNSEICKECRKQSGADGLFCRNLYVQQRRRVIDEDFATFEQSMRRENTLMRLGSDFAVLGLSGAGALAPGAAAVLAAISGGITGARTATERDAYYDKTVTAIFSAMEAARQNVLVKIETGLTKPLDRYDTCSAFTDLEEYRRAGTIDGALAQITTQSGDTVTKDKQQIDVIRGVYSNDDATKALAAFWMPDGKTVDKANEAELKGWMKSHGVKVSPWFFLHDRSLADQRAAAARDLHLPGFGG